MQMRDGKIAPGFGSTKSGDKEDDGDETDKENEDSGNDKSNETEAINYSTILRSSFDVFTARLMEVLRLWELIQQQKAI